MKIVAKIFANVVLFFFIFANSYEIASDYHNIAGLSFYENNYSFTGNYYNRQDCINLLKPYGYFNSIKYEILTFKPDLISRLNITGLGNAHSVIIESKVGGLFNGIWDVKINVYDPQMEINYHIYQSEITQAGFGHINEI